MGGVVLGQSARARSAAQVAGGSDGAMGWRRWWCRGVCDAALSAVPGLLVHCPTHPSLTEEECRVVGAVCVHARCNAQAVGGCDAAGGSAVAVRPGGACDAALPAVPGLLVHCPAHPATLRRISGWCWGSPQTCLMRSAGGRGCDDRVGLGVAVLQLVASATEGARTSVCPSPLLTNAHIPVYTCVQAWDCLWGWGQGVARLWW